MLETDPLLSRCLRRAFEMGTELTGIRVPHAPVHCDFTPSNIFIRGNEAVGFDFNPQSNLPVTIDICRFIMYLDMQRLFPASREEASKWGCREDDLKCFAAAYGLDPTLLDPGVWLKFQFLEITRRLTALKLRAAQGGAPPRSNPDRRLRRTALLVLENRPPCQSATGRAF